MNFKTFAVSTTNIFPAANSKSGGQLLTEFNLRSRESVGVLPDVNYMVGPTYTHGEHDFDLSKQTDGAGTVISGSVLQINEGKALIDGYYVESLAPMIIDLLAANEKARRDGQAPLKGKLVVGLRIMYSTSATMAGAIQVENDDNVYNGLQVVILPPEQFKLPADCPSSREEVTANIKLGEFNFINGNISSIVQNVPNKYQNIDASRIGGVDSLISAGYVRKTGLHAKKLYTFAGKGSDPDSGEDTWCDSTDSLMVWDSVPQLTTEKPLYDQARFLISANKQIQLYIPHKQVDGMTNAAGDPQYYAAKIYSLPIADYSHNTPGTVDSNYTEHIKSIGTKIDNFYQTVKGKQVGYIAVLKDPAELSELNPAWSVGDYILVDQDFTVVEDTSVARAPATMYVVIPGVVSSIKFHSRTTNDAMIPSSISGICISAETMIHEPNTSDAAAMNNIFAIPNVNYRGVANVDYFVATYASTDGNTYRYYYLVDNTQAKEYSQPVYITGSIPFAQESVIGGFLNVPENATDNGYVIRTSSGHLKLLDYELLRSGTLAYQLSDDITIPTNITASQVQTLLDEYINYRIAFRGSNAIVNSSTDPYVIHIYLTLPEDESEKHTYMIRGIDSRFSTAVHLHIKGNAGSNSEVNILDCQKIKIDSNIEGTPVINLYRSNLYYDSTVLDYLTVIEDLSLWYERYSSADPELIVNDMTVTETNAHIISDDIDIWSEDVPNDNHYMYALRSVTFAKDGTIVGCEIYVRNDTTANIEENKYIIVSEFNLPSGAGLTYPATRLTKQLKVTGSFVTAYPVAEPDGYKVVKTDFSALSQQVDQYTQVPSLKGSISLLTDVMFINRIEGAALGTSIDAWEPNSFHVFRGSVIG